MNVVARRRVEVPREHGPRLRPQAPAGGLHRRSVPVLPRAARARSGASHAGRRLPDHALARLRRGLPRCARVLLRQEDRVPPEIRRYAAVRASHHQPRVQRSAAAHPCAPRDPDGAVEPRHRRDGSRPRRAGRPVAGRDGREGARRPDRGFRRRHSGRDHRQPARRAACGSRSAARLVARDPGRARAGADAGADGARQRCGARFLRLSARPGRGSPQASGRSREGSADAPDLPASTTAAD